MRSIIYGKIRVNFPPNEVKMSRKEELDVIEELEFDDICDNEKKSRWDRFRDYMLVAYYIC